MRKPKTVPRTSGVNPPKPTIRKPRVLGGKLAGTGVGGAPLAGVLLVLGATVVGRRLRRTA